MNPTFLRVENFRMFASLPLDLREGVTSLVGPNGAGKSSVADGLDLSLFAEGSRELAQWRGPFADRMELELRFEHAGRDFLIRRSYRGPQEGGGKATLDFEEFVEGECVPLTRETTAATQALINATLGMSRRTFRASVFLGQGDSGAYCEALPSERKSILGEVLDPHALWPKLADRARAEAKQADQDVQRLGVQIAEREPVVAELRRLESDLDICHVNRDAAIGAAKETDEQLEQALGEVQANAAAAERHRAAATALDTATLDRDRAAAELQQATGFAAKLPPAKLELAELGAIAENVEELERLTLEQNVASGMRSANEREKTSAQARVSLARSDLHEIDSDIAALRTRFDAVASRIDHLGTVDAGTERCDRCEQILGVEARDASVASLTAESKTLNEQIVTKLASAEQAADLLATLIEEEAAIEIPEVPKGTFQQDLTTARQAAERRSAVAVLIQGYEEHAALVPALTDALRAAGAAVVLREGELAQAAEAMGDTAQLEQTVARLRLTVTERRNKLDEAKAAVVRVEEQLARARQAATELDGLRSRVNEEQARLDLLKLAERAFGRDGIPTLLAENVIPIIEGEANRILDKLPTSNGTVFRVELRTQREKRDGKGLIESLDILVSDRNTTREFLTFSGGERFRVSFALRWALAKLLAGRRGAESRLLVIDEPDGLDAGGMDGLAQILREEAATFSRILIVSHNPLLASAFDQVIELASDGNVSQIVSPMEMAAA